MYCYSQRFDEMLELISDLQFDCLNIQHGWFDYHMHVRMKEEYCTVGSTDPVQMDHWGENGLAWLGFTIEYLDLFDNVAMRNTYSQSGPHCSFFLLFTDTQKAKLFTRKFQPSVKHLWQPASPEVSVCEVLLLPFSRGPRCFFLILCFQILD